MKSQHRLVLADLPRELGLVLCERLLDEGGITLDRYSHEFHGQLSKISPHAWHSTVTSS